MLIDRQHLAIVRDVVATDSVTAAAERLNVSQSALSHAIAKLEERLGARIWARDGRRLRLTRVGEHLLKLAERLLPEFEHAERMLAELARGRRGALRIGMECHPCERWLMSVTAPYLQRWPDVDLDIRNAVRHDGVAALRAHEIDLLATPDPIQADDLHFVPSFAYELRLAVPADHPLAKQPFIRPRDLTGEVLFTLPVPVERLDIFMQFLVPAQCRPAHQVRIETTELMLQLVAARRGVSVLPDWILRQDGADLPIASLRIGETGLHKSINLGFRTEDRDLDFIASFVEQARQTRQEQPAASGRD